MAKELAKSTSNLNDIVYGGRPRNEEPHVKRTTKKKAEKIEYIVRVDLDELKIDDDEFEDLQSLYQLFDLDRDGILNCREFEKLLRCLGYRLGEAQTRALAANVSVDKINFSVSFNEFLKLMSMQHDVEPDEETLVQMFESFDKENLGMISETVFKQIMSGKDDVNEEDIEEMLEEYYRLAKLKDISTSRPEGAKDDDAAAPTSSPAAKGHQPPTPAKGGGGGGANRRASKPASAAAAAAAAAQRHSLNSGSQVGSDKDERWIDYKEFSAMLQQ